MLQNLSEHVRLCYERATEAKERANEVPDPEAKADFLNWRDVGCFQRAATNLANGLTTSRGELTSGKSGACI
jgi:hypothetical protein